MITFKSRTNIFFFLLLAALAGAIALRLDGAGTASTTPDHKSWPASRASQLVFFAVLEGLYRDGVRNADVDLIVPPGKNGPKFDLENFVYACPLCHPSYEAFRLYRQREPIYGLKAPVDTFGAGRDETVSGGLRSRDGGER